MEEAQSAMEDSTRLVSSIMAWNRTRKILERVNDTEEVQNAAELDSLYLDWERCLEGEQEG